MSIKVSSLVWDKFPKGGSEMLCMLAMADWSNDSGESIHPSIAALSRKMRVSESQARRTVHKLIGEGYLSVIGNHGGGAPGSTRQYKLHIDRLDRGCVDATPSTDARGGTHARRGVAPMRERGGTHATQTVIEPLGEPSVKNKGPSDDEPALPRDSSPANTKPSKKPKKPTSAEFEDFWEACRKNWHGQPGSKAEARKAFDKLDHTKHDLSEIKRLTILECQNRKRQSAQGKFSPAMKHVCRWIKYAGWEEVEDRKLSVVYDPMASQCTDEDMQEMFKAVAGAI